MMRPEDKTDQEPNQGGEMGESNSNVDATKFIFITACCERFQSSRGVKICPLDTFVPSN